MFSIALQNTLNVYKMNAKVVKYWIPHMWIPISFVSSLTHLFWPKKSLTSDTSFRQLHAPEFSIPAPPSSSLSASPSSSSLSASSQMGREEIKYELIKGERGLRGPPGMTVRGPPGEKIEKLVHLVWQWGYHQVTKFWNDFEIVWRFRKLVLMAGMTPPHDKIRYLSETHQQ